MKLMGVTSGGKPFDLGAMTYRGGGLGDYSVPWASPTPAMISNTLPRFSNQVKSVVFSTDGTKAFYNMLIDGIGYTNYSTAVLSTTLNTPFNLNAGNIVEDSKSFPFSTTKEKFASSGGITDMRGLDAFYYNNTNTVFNNYRATFSTDGTKFYTVDPNSGSTAIGGNTNILQGELTTAWDLSTMNTSSVIKTGNTGSDMPYSKQVLFKPDGLKMYVVGNRNASFHNISIREYTLTTAWDVTTSNQASGGNTTVNMETLTGLSLTLLNGAQFSSDGSKLIFCDFTRVFRASMSTPWDISTLSFVDNSAHKQTYSTFMGSISASGANDQNILISADGKRTYATNESSGTNYLVSGTLTTAWELGNGWTQDSPAQNVLTMNRRLYDSNDRCAGMQWGLGYGDEKYIIWCFSDGGGIRKLYLGGPNGSSVNTTAVSATLGMSLFAMQSGINPTSTVSPQIRFKSDGTKVFYYLGDSKFTENTLGDAWDIYSVSATANNNSSFGETISGTLYFCFSTDGTKLIYGSGTKVRVHSLSSAWDVTTISANSTSDFDIPSGVINGIDINPSGTKLNLIIDDETFRSYTMSSAFDVSVSSLNPATFSSKSHAGFAGTEGLTSITFNGTGTQFTAVTSSTIGNRPITFRTTAPYDVSQAKITSTAQLITRSTSGSEKVQNTCFDFSPDGTKILFAPRKMSGSNYTRTYFVGTLSTGFDLSTWTSTASATAPSQADPSGTVVRWGDSGDSIYLVENNLDKVWRIPLTSTYDITGGYGTGTNQSNNLLTSAEGFCWKPDGTKIYFAGYDQPNTQSVVQEFDVSPAWDITGFTMTSGSPDAQLVVSGSGMPFNQSSNSNTEMKSQLFSANLRFSPDGTKMFVSNKAHEPYLESTSTFNGFTRNTFSFTLSTPWSVATATYDQQALDSTSVIGRVGDGDFQLSADGKSLFVLKLHSSTQRAFSTNDGNPREVLYQLEVV